MNDLNIQLQTKAQQDQALEALNRACGVPLEPGTVLHYTSLEDIRDPEERKQKAKDLEEKDQTLKILRVEFKDIDRKNPKGEIIELIAPITPFIVVEISEWNPKTKKYEKKEKEIPAVQFRRMIDIQDMTEKVDTKDELEQLIGESVNEKDVFEYRDIYSSLAGTPMGINKKIEIDKIDHETKQITLSEEVITAAYPNPRREKTLTFGAFAKWYRRSEALKPIESLQELQKKLENHNAELNKKYNREPPEKYPPIKVEENEVLMYETDPPATFVIKKVDEENNEIGLDNGSKHTFSSFYRWVKNNEVEKRDANAEAKKATDMIENDAERTEAFKEELEKAANKNQDRINDGEQPPEGFTFDNDSVKAQKSVNYFRKLWSNTYFLSPDSFLEMGKTFVEFWKRRWKRREQNRIGTVGELAFPGLLGSEFTRIKQASENEEVNNFKETYSQLGADELIKILHGTNNKDELKALLQVLSEKGLVRWDDEKIWDTIDRISNGSPGWIRQYRSPEEGLEAVIDAFWGTDSFRELRNKNDSSYESIKSQFNSNAERLENDPQQIGGLGGKIRELLFKHKEGKYVNPAELEAYLHFSMEAGKMGFAEKLQYLILAAGMEGKNGMPLFHVDRVAAIEAKLLNNFPILDYFVDPAHIKYDENGKIIPKRKPDGSIVRDANGNPVPETMKPGVNFYKKLIRDHCLEGPITSADDLEPTKKFGDFLDKNLIWNEYAGVRITEKSVRFAEGWDHDDMHMFAPLLGEETIEQLTLKAGGAKQQTSVMGLKNAMAGMNNFTKNSMEFYIKAGDEKEAKKWMDRMTNTMRGFIRIDSILDRRCDQKASNRTRFDDKALDDKPLVDNSRSVRTHVEEMRQFIGDLSVALGIDADWNIIITKSRDEKEWNRQQNTVREFGGKLHYALNKYRQTNGDEALKNLLNSIQTKNKARGIEIKGIMDAELVKKEKPVETAPGAARYERDDIVDKVQKIKDLRGGRAVTKEELQRRERRRVEEVIQLADAGRIEQISDEDGKLLDGEINRLEGRGGGGTTPGGGSPPSGGATV